jgi:hypothetical protein
MAIAPLTCFGSENQAVHQHCRADHGSLAGTVGVRAAVCCGDCARSSTYWRSYTPTIPHGLSPSGRPTTRWHVRAKAGRHPEDEYQAAVKRFPAGGTLSLKRFALGHA